MGEVYTYDATHLTKVREGTAEFTQSAELGAVGSGRFSIHDEAGTISIVGQKDFAHTESSCATPLTFRGYIADRSYKREADPKVSASREIEVELVDLNAMLGFRLIDGTDGRRPAETVAERGAWLMGSDYVSGLFDDNGRCDFSSGKGMTKANYRSQYPGDVLADMALAQGGGVNYHVNDYGSGPELTFRNDNTSTDDSSTLRISNVLADASAVTLHPFKDAVLRRSPANVHSKNAYSYAKGIRYNTRAATAAAFNGERGGAASNSNIKTAEKADDEAQDLLFQHSTEEDAIECTVLATSAQVNLMPPGWRIQGKFSHLNTEGYGSFTWFRILEVTKKPIVADGGLYEVRLKLSPQEAAAPVGAIVQSAMRATGAGGGTSSFPNPVTIGNLLVYMGCKRDSTSAEGPTPPNTDVDHPRWGAGAWTDATPSATFVEWDTKNSPPAYREGIKLYWKIADSTEQDGGIDEYTISACWELSGSTMTGATIVSKSLQSTSTTHAIGSLGTPAAGRVALLILGLGADVAQGAGAAVNLNPGDWVRDIFGDSFQHVWNSDSNSIGFNTPAPPSAWLGHQISDGAALAATLTDTTAHKWGGIAVLLATV